MTLRMTPRKTPRKTIRPAAAPARGRRRLPSADAGSPLALALQGGGSHGAFTWGALDRLLEDDSLVIGGLCGTSAGALNAAVLATGLARGGRVGARAALRAFWQDVGGRRGCFGMAGPGESAAAQGAGPLFTLAGFNLDTNPWYAWANAWLKSLSPYQFNPLNINPLRDVVQRHVDLAAIERAGVPVFVVATAVTTGRPAVFTGRTLTHDALLASTCLPHLFQAVTIGGEAYWDGGYTGNPALWPLIYDTPASDLLLLRINPLRRPGIPDTPMAIADRVAEVSFNASLIGEMRAIAFVQRLLAEGRVGRGRYKDLRIHMIADDAGLGPLNASSKLNTDPRFIEGLFRLGRAAAEQWMLTDRPLVGRRSTVDIAATFLDG